MIDRRPGAAFALFLAPACPTRSTARSRDAWAGRARWRALIDPVADKALLVTMFITLAAVNDMPSWLAILVVFRDAVIVGRGAGAGAARPRGGDPSAVRLQGEHRAADHSGRADLVPRRIRRAGAVGRVGSVGTHLGGRRKHGLPPARPMCGARCAANGTGLAPSGPTPAPPPVAAAGTPPAEVPARDASRRSFPRAVPWAVPGPSSGPLAGPAGRARATPVCLALALAVLGWLVLRLFSGVLAPFVTAGVIAYALDPPATRLTRLGLPRGLAALVMVLAMLACVLLFVLLLYPLILSQVGLLLGRVPQYAQALQQWGNDLLTEFQKQLGPDVVNSRLRDLVASQAGTVLSFLASTIASLITCGFALFNVLTLVVVTPVAAFYLLRDWKRIVAMIDGWLPLRRRPALREQAREVDRILSAWVRGQALCCVILGLDLRGRPVARGAGNSG